MKGKSCYTRYPCESWATGYQWAGMQRSGYKAGEHDGVVEVDEELYQDSNTALVPSSETEQRCLHEDDALGRSREHQSRNHAQKEHANQFKSWKQS